MTKYQREKQKFLDAAQNAGEKAGEAYGTVEKKADEAVDKGVSILQKLKDQKWTAAALTGAGLLAAFLLIK